MIPDFARTGVFSARRTCATGSVNRNAVEVKKGREGFGEYVYIVRVVARAGQHPKYFQQISAVYDPKTGEIDNSTLREWLVVNPD